MRIGVLALQGAFAEHIRIFQSLGVETFEIRQLSDLEQEMNAIVLPGGESTVIGKLLRELNMILPVRKMIKEGLPCFGTCAGLILLAERVEGNQTTHIGTMDITAKRNAYGRQLGSFHTKMALSNIGKIPMTFIRAPYIVDCGKSVEVLARYEGKIIAARQEHQLVTAFHPELTESKLVHNYFLEEIVRKTE